MYPEPAHTRDAGRVPWGVTYLLTLALLLMTAVLLSGCGSKSATYVDPDYRFSFEYQDSWDLVETPTDQLPPEAAKSIGVFDPRGSDAGDDLTFDYMSVDVYEVGLEAIPTLDKFRDYFAFYIERLEASDDTLRVLDPLRATSVNGAAGFKVTYMYHANETDVRCSEYRLIDTKGIVYGLLIQASDENWEIDNEFFSMFLDTFSLGPDT